MEDLQKNKNIDSQPLPTPVLPQDEDSIPPTPEPEENQKKDAHCDDDEQRKKIYEECIRSYEEEKRKRMEEGLFRIWSNKWDVLSTFPETSF